MTTSTPPQSGVFPNAKRRTSTAPPPSSSMPGVDASPPDAALDAVPVQSASPPGQTLLHLRLPGQNTAEFATAIQVLAGALLTPRKARWFRRPTPAAEEIAALELVGEPQRVTFGLRGPDPLVQRLFAQLVAGYRQVEPVQDDDTPGEVDPLVLHPGEAASWTELHLAKPAAIPCETPDPRNPRAFAQGADPLRGILEALAATPAPLRAVAQLVVRPAPAGWEQANRRQMQQLERQRRQALAARPETGNEWSLLLLVLLLFGGLLTLWLAMQGLLGLAFLLLKLAAPLALLGGIVLLVLLGRRAALRQQWVGHEPLIADKLSGSVVETCLRLYVLGPASAKPLREQTLSNLAELYASVTAGPNRFVPTRTRQIGPIRLGSGLEEEPHRAMRVLPLVFTPDSRWQRLVLWWGGDRVRPVLSLAEAATLWHLPQTAHDTPYLTVQPSQQRLPAPGLLTIPPTLLQGVPRDDLPDPAAWSVEARQHLGGYVVGVSSYAGQTTPIRFPTALLEDHVAIVASTGSGKSALLQQLLRWAFAEPDTTIFVFDPHSDLTWHLAGLVRPEDLKQRRVVLLDPTDASPVGLPSLYDPTLGTDWSRHQTHISNLVDTIEQLSGDAWGQRVRTNFYHSLTTLVRACLADQAAGRPVQVHTLLDVYPLFASLPYCNQVLLRLNPDDPLDLEIKNTWIQEVADFNASQWAEKIGSVLNRIAPHRLTAGGNLLGQRRPRWSLRKAILRQQICLMALGGLGLNIRRSLGSLLLSYLQGVLLDQQQLAFQQRRRILVVIDELQAFEPQALIGLFGEVRKFGGRVIVATNSLQKIQHTSPELAAELKNNIGTWIVGQIGDEEEGEHLLTRIQGTARGPLTLADVQNLPRRHFFVRAKVAGTPQPVFRMVAPPYAASNAEVAEEAVWRSRRRYGRARAEVQGEIFDHSRDQEVTILARALTRSRQKAEQANSQSKGNSKGKSKGAGATPSGTAGPAKPPNPAEAETEAAKTVRQNARVVDPDPAPASAPAAAFAREQREPPAEDAAAPEQAAEEAAEDVKAEKAKAAAAAAADQQGAAEAPPPPKPGTRAAAFASSNRPHPRSSSAERQAAASGRATWEEEMW